MTGLPGGAFLWGCGAWRGLAGLGGFWTGSWRVLGGRKYAPENGFRGVGGFGFRKGWEGFGFRGVEGLAFERGGGGWMLGRLGLGVACYLSFCRLVLYAKPTTFAIVKTKATPPRGACYGINTNTHNHY